MTTRTTLALIALAVLLTVAAAAALTAPSGSPEVGALPAADDEAGTGDDGSATGPTDQPPRPTPAVDGDGGRPTGGREPTGGGAPAMRPEGPTGKPGGVQQPSFDGRLEASQIPVLRDAPELIGIDGWLQADGIHGLADTDGAVRVVQFWTFSCSNCKATLANLRALRDTHGGRDDFAIIGVHAPEFPFEEDPDAVADAAADLDVSWPIALDTDKRSFHHWQEGSRAYWPRTYVLDRDGRIRFDHVGEGRYDELNATVTALLGAADA